jgi:HEAT repeat protein
MVVLVLLIGGGFLGINAMIKKDPGTAYVVVTAISSKITNAIIPSPNLVNKKPEERKGIIIKYLKEMAEAEERWQLLKRTEIEKRILRMGDLIVPVLIEIFRTSRERMVSYEAHAILIDIAECKSTPVDEIDPDWKKRIYKEAKRIDIESAVPRLIEVACDDKENNYNRDGTLLLLGEMEDTRAVEPLIKLLEDKRLEDKKTCRGEVTLKETVEGVLCKILWKTKDRRIAEALDRDGSNYGVWVEIDREKAISKAMEAFKKNPKDRYAIGVLGNAKAEEAVSMLIELLERERDFDIKDSIINTLGKTGDRRAVESLIQILKQKTPRGQRCNTFAAIKALGEIGDERAVTVLKEILSENEDFELFQKEIKRSLKKITGKEYKVRGKGHGKD